MPWTHATRIHSCDCIMKGIANTRVFVKGFALPEGFPTNVQPDAHNCVHNRDTHHLRSAG